MIVNNVMRNGQFEKRVLLRDAKETFVNVIAAAARRDAIDQEVAKLSKLRDLYDERMSTPDVGRWEALGKELSALSGASSLDSGTLDRLAESAGSRTEAPLKERSALPAAPDQKDEAARLEKADEVKLEIQRTERQLPAPAAPAPDMSGMEAAFKGRWMEGVVQQADTSGIFEAIQRGSEKAIRLENQRITEDAKNRMAQQQVNSLKDIASSAKQTNTYLASLAARKAETVASVEVTGAFA